MYIKRSIKFLLHKRKSGETKKLAIRMRVTLAGERPIDFPIGHKIDVSDWDMDTERAKIDKKNKNNQIATEINRTIDECKSIINEVFARFELLEKRKPTQDEIKNLFNDMSGRKTIISEIIDNNDIGFFCIFDTFIRTVGEQNQWTPATYEKFAAIKSHLETFDRHLSFQSISEPKMQEYVKYLTNKGFRNTTIAKNLSFVRWFFRWASNKDYYKGNIHNTFRPKLKGIDGNAKEVIYLTQEEIKILSEHVFTDRQKYLERVRDVFLFTCFTGLRYSDTAKLTRHDIKDGFIEIVTQKTVDGIRIELNKHSQAIIKKYSNIEFPNNKALPVISNVKMNEYLKELGQICELNEPQRIVYFIGNTRYEDVYPKWALLTTHCGRRTFVVNALRLGIPAEVIIRWTGHSDYKAMKPYIKIVDELKQREMTKFDNMFS